MKRIGILYDKDSKKVFLLPEEVKQLTSSGVAVLVASGLGNCIGISDAAYTQAGARVCEQWSDVVQADVILKVDAFNKKEIALIKNKPAITMANYLINVDMLFNMLKNNTIGFQWNKTANNKGYVFFPRLEELKVPHILKFLKDAFAKGLAKREKDKVVYPKKPRLLILYATFAGVELAKQAIASGFEVTLADNDSKYLSELKQTSALKNLGCIDAKYETLVEKVKTHNALVVTATSPCDIALNRITKDMAETMPKGSLLIDAGCENGYSFQFVKGYADKKVQWKKVGKSFYMCYEDFTNLFGKQASEIISKHSVNYLTDLLADGKSEAEKTIICRDGQVIDSNVKTTLKLY